MSNRARNPPSRHTEPKTKEALATDAARAGAGTLAADSRYSAIVTLGECMTDETKDNPLRPFILIDWP